MAKKHGPPKDVYMKGARNSRKPKAMARRNLTTQNNRLANVIENLTAAGLTKRDVEAIFGMGTTTSNYAAVLKKTPDLQLAHDEGMKKLENVLTGKMLAKALGYDYAEEKITYVRKNRQWIQSKKEVYKKHNSGSDTLLIFFMTNRFGENWKQSKELVTKKEGYDPNPTERVRKTIKSYARDVLAEDTSEPEGECIVQDRPASVHD